MRRWILSLTALLGVLALACTEVRFAQAIPDGPIPKHTIVIPVVIATGNTFQTVLSSIASSQTSRLSITIVNNNATDSCWITVDGGTPAKATSILLLAGGQYFRSWPYVPYDAIQATCATTNDTLYVDQQ